MFSPRFLRLISISISTFVAASVLSAYSAPVASAQSRELLSEIEELYANSNFDKALAIINENLRLSPPGTANLHYLKANILAAQGQTSQAASEYSVALQENPSATVRNYCERALIALRTTAPSTMAVLDRQVRHEVNRTQKQSAAVGRAMKAEAMQYQQVHSARTTQITNDMANAGSYDQDGDWIPAYDPSEIAARQAQRDAHEAAVVSQFARSSQDAQNAGQARSDAVQDSAAGLRSQIGGPLRPGDATLNSSTSNLFVRNYAEPASSTPATSPMTPSSTPRPATVTVP